MYSLKNQQFFIFSVYDSHLVSREIHVRQATQSAVPDVNAEMKTNQTKQSETRHTLLYHVLLICAFDCVTVPQ